MKATDHKRTGSTEIANLLRQEIDTGKLAPRERLPPERVLANLYNVARGTVREALNRLAEDGLVEIRRGSGTYVTGEPKIIRQAVFTTARPLELIDARFALEPHICRMAVLHARPQDLELMEEQLGAMELGSNDSRTYAAADAVFHKLLAKCAGNALLEWFMAEINAVRNQAQWSRMRELTLNEEIIRIYNQQHRDILGAIRDRDPEQAASMMKGHLETARLSLTRAAAT